MRNNNVLLIITDEHTREALGCCGTSPVLTPNLDRLVQRGTRFDRAYTASPVCAPARASIATGRYVHETGFWGNAQPYDGSVPTWGHRLIGAGHRVVSVGKLHYRSGEDDNGFEPEIIPLHVRDGVGWLHGLLGRHEGATWDGTSHFAEEIGPGVCDYNRYDLQVCERASAWLRHEAPKQKEKPWVLCASFVSPHYPLIVPKQYFDLYDPRAIPPPRLAESAQWSTHPVVQGVRRFFNYDDYFDAASRQIAKVSYYGLCSFVDDQIGRVLQALEDSGQAENTVIVYTSDHGEMMGNHGLWTKCNMYEESVGIPMIVAGPAIPQKQVIDEPVSLLDIYPTILESTGLGLTEGERELPGRSLCAAANGQRFDRVVLSEYHDGGSITGMFMIRKDKWKYVCYPGFAPQLFDLEADPCEARDLGTADSHEHVRAAMDRALRGLVDPDRANERAFADQALRIAELGGHEAILKTANFDQSPAPI